MGKNINLSNALSLFRLFVSPVVMLLIIFDKRYSALTLFILASLTDLADGYIARKFKKETRFGEILDRIADKLLVGFALTGALIKLKMIGWLVVFCFIILLYILIGYKFLKLKHKPVLIGRLNVVLQTIAIISFIMDFYYKWVFLLAVIIITTGVGFFYIYRILKDTYKK